MRGKAEQSEELRIYIFILNDFRRKTLPEIAKIKHKKIAPKLRLFFDCYSKSLLFQERFIVSCKKVRSYLINQVKSNTDHDD